MITLLFIAALIYVIYQLHNRLKVVDPKYREAVKDDDESAEIVANKAIAAIKRFFKRIGDKVSL